MGAIAGIEKHLPFIIITIAIASLQIPPNGMEMQAQEDKVMKCADKNCEFILPFNSRVIFTCAAISTKLDGHTERSGGEERGEYTREARNFTFFLPLDRIFNLRKKKVDRFENLF